MVAHGKHEGATLFLVVDRRFNRRTRSAPQWLCCLALPLGRAIYATHLVIIAARIPCAHSYESNIGGLSFAIALKSLQISLQVFPHSFNGRIRSILDNLYERPAAIPCTSRDQVERLSEDVTTLMEVPPTPSPGTTLARRAHTLAVRLLGNVRMGPARFSIHFLGQ